MCTIAQQLHNILFKNLRIDCDGNGKSSQYFEPIFLTTIHFAQHSYQHMQALVYIVPLPHIFYFIESHVDGERRDSDNT